MTGDGRPRSSVPRGTTQASNPAARPGVYLRSPAHHDRRPGMFHVEQIQTGQPRITGRSLKRLFHVERFRRCPAGRRSIDSTRRVPRGTVPAHEEPDDLPRAALFHVEQRPDGAAPPSFCSTWNISGHRHWLLPIFRRSRGDVFHVEQLRAETTLPLKPPSRPPRLPVTQNVDCSTWNNQQRPTHLPMFHVEHRIVPSGGLVASSCRVGPLFYVEHFWSTFLVHVSLSRSRRNCST